MSEEIKGYKIFRPNYVCRDYKYSFGKNVYKGDLKMCQSVVDCLTYYDLDDKNIYMTK